MIRPFLEKFDNKNSPLSNKITTKALNYKNGIDRDDDLDSSDGDEHDDIFDTKLATQVAQHTTEEDLNRQQINIEAFIQFTNLLTEFRDAKEDMNRR